MTGKAIKINKTIDQFLSSFAPAKMCFALAKDESAVGGITFTPAVNTYKKLFNIKNAPNLIQFEQKLSRSDVDMINRTGHWLNQTAIIGLCAILEVTETISNKKEKRCWLLRSKNKGKIDTQLPGGQLVRLIVDFRNAFAHGQLHYDKELHRKLANRQIKLLDLKTDPEQIGDFDLSIHTVIKPLFEGAKRYVTAYWGDMSHGVGDKRSATR